MEGDTRSSVRTFLRKVISIHALRVEGDFIHWIVKTLMLISIHALRVEGDCIRPCRPNSHHKFLSTPSGWRATKLRWQARSRVLFLSTPSGWRATSRLLQISSWVPYFYPRPPGGGRRYRYDTITGRKAISIHALRVEGDNGELVEADV